VRALEPSRGLGLVAEPLDALARVLAGRNPTADDYAALPETANVYPSPQPATASASVTQSAALDGSPSQAISSLMKPGAREG